MEKIWHRSRSYRDALDPHASRRSSARPCLRHQAAGSSAASVKYHLFRCLLWSTGARKSFVPLSRSQFSEHLSNWASHSTVEKVMLKFSISSWGITLVVYTEYCSAEGHSQETIMESAADEEQPLLLDHRHLPPVIFSSHLSVFSFNLRVCVFHRPNISCQEIVGHCRMRELQGQQPQQMPTHMNLPAESMLLLGQQAVGRRRWRWCWWSSSRRGWSSSPRWWSAMACSSSRSSPTAVPLAPRSSSLLRSSVRGAPPPLHLLLFICSSSYTLRSLIPFCLILCISDSHVCIY